MGVLILSISERLHIFMCLSQGDIVLRIGGGGLGGQGKLSSVYSAGGILSVRAQII